VSFVLTGVMPPLVLGAEYNDMTIDFSSMDVQAKVPPDDAPFADPEEQIILEPNQN
jgi:hypothetical protein